MDRLVCETWASARRSGAARRLRGRHGRQTGGRRRADDAARPPALQDLCRALQGPAVHRGPGLAHGRLGRSRRRQEGPADGTVDIVVGTHALLGKTIAFKDLGLVIVDEEQHFGVGHKERLKELRAEVHVLTLTATPIPRTLQLAMTGVRDLSIIATPPVDRLAVRSFVTPFDPLVIREPCCASATAAARPSSSARASRTWRCRGLPARARAGGEVHRRPRPDGRRRARGPHRRLL